MAKYSASVKLMFAIGHFALGYIAGKGTSKLLNTSLNVPLLLAVSVIPDIDLLLGILDPTTFMHRGVTHSVFTYAAIMIPLFIVYGRQAVPYFAVLLSHSLLGDLFNGGIEMFWPLTQDWFGNRLLEVGSLADALAELVLFAVVTPVMVKLGDLRGLLRPDSRNWLLIIGFGAVLGPMLSGGELQAILPMLLLVPSLFWLTVFAYSVLSEMLHRSKKPPTAS